MRGIKKWEIWILWWEDAVLALIWLAVLKKMTSSNAINMAGHGRGRKYCTIMQEEEKWGGERLKKERCRLWSRIRQGVKIWTNMLLWHTSTHKIHPDWLDTPPPPPPPIFSSLTMSLLINSCFPCYEADGSVRRGMQTNYCPEGSEEQEEKSQKEREEGGGGRNRRDKREKLQTQDRHREKQIHKNANKTFFKKHFSDTVYNTVWQNHLPVTLASSNQSPEQHNSVITGVTIRHRLLSPKLISHANRLSILCR